MKHNLRVRSITRLLVSLFIGKKPNMTFLNRKDEYYKAYWVNKNMSNGIELVAKIEQLSKKDTAQYLLERGFSSYMGEKVAEFIEQEKAAKELNQKVQLTRFIRELRKFAKERGMDISKLF